MSPHLAASSSPRLAPVSSNSLTALAALVGELGQRGGQPRQLGAVR